VERVREYAQNLLQNGNSGELQNTIKQKANEYAQTVVGEVQQSTTQYVKDKAKEMLTTVGEEIINKAKDFFGIATSSSAGTSPLQGAVVSPPTGPGFVVPPPPATIAYGIGESFAISINSGSSYTVDWGSGTSESGKTAASGLTVLKHSWSKEGDYTVRVFVTDSGKTNTYTFPLRVYK